MRRSISTTSYNKKKLPETHEEWLADRMKGIGGSDVSAILGLNPYKSAYSLWAEKTETYVPEDKDSEAMRQGRDLEQYVAERFMEATGKRVWRSGYSFQSKEHPFMLANVDRMVINERAGLECKTASPRFDYDWSSGEIPNYYYCQCMHYLAVTGWDRWYLAVLVHSEGFYVFTIERDENEIKALIQAEEEFWQMVQDKTPPAIDGSNSTCDTIKGMYPNSEDIKIDLDGYVDECSRLDEIKAQIKELQTQQKELENVLKDAMQEAEKAENDDFRITWKSSTKPKLQKELLIQHLKDTESPLIRQFTEDATTRTFRFSKKKKKETK